METAWVITTAVADPRTGRPQVFWVVHDPALVATWLRAAEAISDGLPVVVREVQLCHFFQHRTETA